MTNTLGPFTVTEQADRFFIDSPRCAGIAQVGDKAHADLFAAAPDLLAALQAYIESDDIGARIGTPKYKTARAAIAKATGDAS